METAAPAAVLRGRSSHSLWRVIRRVYPSASQSNCFRGGYRNAYKDCILVMGLQLGQQEPVSEPSL